MGICSMAGRIGAVFSPMIVFLVCFSDTSSIFMICIIFSSKFNSAICLPHEAEYSSFFWKLVSSPKT